ncbi:MAG: UPF0182 family protein [Chloroflexi bacterium]|nr:UPF0182 family protein [Chloroflexota bacterium]
MAVASVLGALLLAFIVLSVGKMIVANVLWFDSVGYGSVYSKRIITRIWLFFAGAILALAIIVANIIAARRLAPTADAPDFAVSPDLRGLYDSLHSPGTRRGILAAAGFVLLLIAVLFGSAAAGRWNEILLFSNAQSFGRTDPQFGRDLSFYVFKLPVYQSFLDWILGVLVVSTIAAALVYFLRAILYGFRINAPRPIMRHIFDIEAPRWIKLHASILVLGFLAVFVAGYYFDRFALVYSTRGVDVGAFYTDIHASLPLLYVQMGVASLAAILVLIGLFRGGIALPGVAVVAWIAVSIGSAIYPAFVQRFIVQPNELTREEPYLARNIEMTRWAYGLDQVDVREFAANASATAEEVDDNQETIANTRLWDPDPLRAGLSQLQTIRPLFEFNDVDVDRYTIDGKYRQVMLSARELNPDRLPADAQTWVNRTLQFTHGYGYAVAAVNQAESDGSPTLLVKDIPLQGPLMTARPEIYFGEQPDRYIIVDGKEQEFTPVAGGANVATRFSGNGGVALGSFWRKALYAWAFADPNILISGALGADSRIIYRRNIQERIRTIAPFLLLDADPYMVVDKDNIYWIQDAYTATGRIPYSSNSGDINYIRNSVKVIVNAYSGETIFYAVQPDEPLLKAYSSVFPSLFKPISAMPDSLRSHLRYPEDLFRVQTQKYLRYHIQDARAFYQKEDQWDIPQEIFGGTNQAVRPYYVIARLPGERKEEFMLILPFAPRNRTNAVAWIAARSDGDNYGKLVSFRFPSTISVPGPTQVERRIDSDGRVSQQLTLWNQSGSKVIRGNLLMIPIGNANLFFEPLYLSAAGSGNEIPQLKRIVVVNGENVAMEPTLARALDVLFGRAQPSSVDTAGVQAPSGPNPTPSPATATPTRTPAPGTPAATTSPAPAGDIASLIAQAQDAYDRAQAALKAGDFAGYGAEITRLKQILDRLQQAASP